MVAFQRTDDPNAPVEEVVAGDGRSLNVEARAGHDGRSNSYAVSLSKLLPVAIEHSSTPMKRE